MKKYVVTGSTGCLGMALCRLLKENENCQVIGLGRNKNLGQQLEKLGIDFQVMDLNDVQTLKEVSNQADVIFHCAALSAPWGKFQDFYQANVLGTEHVIQATRQGTRLIHVSSPSVYFNFKHQYNIKEDAPLPLKAANFYVRTKLDAEQRIQHAHVNHALDVITIRPRGIFGPYDRSILPSVMGLYRNGRMPIVGDGTQQIDISYVDNVAFSLIKAATAPSFCSGKIYNITNDEPIAFIDILNLLFEQFNLKVSFQYYPYYFIKPIAHVLNALYKLPFIKTTPPITPYTLGVMALGQTLDISQAKTDLGYAAFINIQEGIKRYVQWMRQ